MGRRRGPLGRSVTTRMAWLAEGSSAMVVTPIASGSLVLLISAFIDPLFGLGPLLGVLLLCAASWLLLRFRDPPRKIPQDAGLLVAPIDGRVVHLRRERATHRRPGSDAASAARASSSQGGPQCSSSFAPRSPCASACTSSPPPRHSSARRRRTCAGRTRRRAAARHPRGGDHRWDGHHGRGAGHRFGDRRRRHR